MDLPIQWEGWRHHHWLLIRLALKTGDVTRIWSAYGEGGLAGLMGLSEEVHSPDDFRVPQVGLGASGCSAVCGKKAESSIYSQCHFLLFLPQFRDMHFPNCYCCECETHQLQYHHQL